MDLSIEEIERLHDSGQMPDFYYYQVNGKSAGENFVKIYNKRQAERRERQKREELDAIIEKELDKKIPDIIDKAVKDIFKDFGK